MIRLPLVALSMCLTQPGVALGDWPHVRGLHYDGVSRETHLADTWPATGPPKLWSRDLGQGYASS